MVLASLKHLTIKDWMPCEVSLYLQTGAWNNYHQRDFTQQPIGMDAEIHTQAITRQSLGNYQPYRADLRQ